MQVTKTGPAAGMAREESEPGMRPARSLRSQKWHRKWVKNGDKILKSFQKSRQKREPILVTKPWPDLVSKTWPTTSDKLKKRCPEGCVNLGLKIISDQNLKKRKFLSPTPVLFCLACPIWFDFWFNFWAIFRNFEPFLDHFWGPNLDHFLVPNLRPVRDSWAQPDWNPPRWDWKLPRPCPGGCPKTDTCNGAATAYSRC